MIAHAKLLGPVNNADYLHQTEKRGHPGYVMSRSELMRFARNPRKWLDGATDEENDGTIWGSLVDCMILTPDRLQRDFAVRPHVDGKLLNANSNQYKEWASQQGKATIVKPADLDAAGKAVEALIEDWEVYEVIHGSRRQVGIIATWQEGEIEIPIRALIDIVPSDEKWKSALADLKTGRNVSPAAWPRVCYERGYHVQGALYLDLWNAATGEQRDTFLHICQENTAPYAVGRRNLSQEFLQLGRSTYRQALMRYADCLTSGQWPGYDDGWSIVEPAAWMVDLRESFRSIDPLTTPLAEVPEDWQEVVP